MEQFLALSRLWFGLRFSEKSPRYLGYLSRFSLCTLLHILPLWLALLLIAAASVFGVWLCGRVATDLGVHDHGGIVWDEFVGIWITLIFLPNTWLWLLLGFVVFRLLDIAKPWPISVLDRKVGGGFGIMIDDILAGVIAAGVLYAAWFFTL